MHIWGSIVAALMVISVLWRGPQVTAAPPAPDRLDVSLAARTLQPGELIVVTIRARQPISGLTVRVFNQQVPAFPTTGAESQALVGIDLDQAPGRYPLLVEARLDDQVITSERELVVLAKQFPTRALRVAPDFVNPPPEVAQRLERESALVSAAYAASAHERLWTAPFSRPVPQPANSRFGTRSVFNGERRSPHAGTDFLSGAGTPVKAPNAGRVVIARDLFFSGNTVIIDHGLGLFSMLAHLSRIDVREGEAIDNGRIVGLVGATGRVTGPHLHWALRVNGARVDPLAALSLLGPPRP